ncbi:uncharacterized protein LOC141859031 isoform X1 [Acropora palmata]|uniref:uncharacterized protein LOC141859031 isoform X1 n=1 Tax=Acropora palmata TaxID=6131 RepID=UPI003DA1C284
MDPRSMDHLFGPGPWTPLWTTRHFKRQPTQNGRRWVSECLSSQSFGFAGRCVIDLKCIYFSHAGICGADWPDSSDSAEDESSCSKSLTQMASLKVRWLWFALLGITDSIP